MDTIRLDNIRNVLARLEETIIFALIERAQFLTNRAIYEPKHFGEALGHDSLVGYLLHECERSHARVRRYTSPDEHPFYGDLPDPILPSATYENPLIPNAININARIRATYEDAIVPHICREGDDHNYGSSAVCDVACLQALSKRIHYGKFVAESKYQENPERFRPAMTREDPTELMELITNEHERAVVDRVAKKASTYTQELADTALSPVVDPMTVADIYSRWIIPLNKEVQVLYLLVRERREQGHEKA